MADVTSIFAAAGGGLMGALPGAFLGYRQGRKAEESRRDADVEERLRRAELELAAIRATLHTRRNNHTRKANP